MKKNSEESASSLDSFAAEPSGVEPDGFLGESAFLDQDSSIASQDEVLARLGRRIRGAIAQPPKRRKRRPYFVTTAEDFWERHLPDLVHDSLSLGVARYQGLEPIGELLRHAFTVLAPLLQGYIGVGGHVNNLALEAWRPNSSRPRAKIDALVQLHARSLVLLDETFALIYSGFPSGAEAISRTLHEVAVTAMFLHKFKAELAERYLASHIVELWKSKSDFVPRRGAAQTGHWRAFEKELDEKYAGVIRKHGDSIAIPNGWAWPRFDDKSKGQAKLPRRIPFSWIQEAVGETGQRGRYRQNSHHVHAVHLGTIKTLVHREAETLVLGPRPFGFITAGWDALRDTQVATDALLRSCGRCADDPAIYYWLEALDQLSNVLQNMVISAGSTLDSIFERDADDD
jgi:hypothetical protein